MEDEVIYWKAVKVSTEKQKPSHSRAVFSSTAEGILDETISGYCKKERGDISRYIDFFIASTASIISENAFVLISVLLAKDSVKKALLKKIKVEVYLSHYKFYIKKAELTNVLFEDLK